jgi:molybdate-binding protein
MELRLVDQVDMIHPEIGIEVVTVIGGETAKTTGNRILKIRNDGMAQIEKGNINIQRIQIIDLKIGIMILITIENDGEKEIGVIMGVTGEVGSLLRKEDQVEVHQEIEKIDRHVI